MSDFARILVAILTLLFGASLLGFGIFALTIPSVPTFLICLVIAAGFGFFSYLDYKRFFGNKQ